MNHNILRFLFFTILTFFINPPGICQSEMPDILQKGSLPEQLNYIEERTRIYEYYRAIREDMFQQIKKNTLDSLTSSKADITLLTTAKDRLNLTIDSLNTIVKDTRARLEDAVRTKNNIRVLGNDVNKFAYNSFMWVIIISLAALLALGFLAFKRNLIITKNTRKDLEDLKTEFEAYRKKSREAREKMSMDHFNELRKLKAKSSEYTRSEATKFREAERAHKERSDEVPRSGRAQSSEERTVDENPKDEIPQGDTIDPDTAGEMKKPHKRRPRRPEQNDSEA